jgi:hypothetical protein
MIQRKHRPIEGTKPARGVQPRRLEMEYVERFGVSRREHHAAKGA